jgi:hypothetical protein
MGATPTVPEKLPLTRGHRAVRYAGSVVLSSCAVMLVLGLTGLRNELLGPRFVIYWASCFLLALVSMGFACGDMILVRRAYKRTRRELFRSEFMAQNWTDRKRD